MSILTFCAEIGVHSFLWVNKNVWFKVQASLEHICEHKVPHASYYRWPCGRIVFHVCRRETAIVVACAKLVQALARPNTSKPGRVMSIVLRFATELLETLSCWKWEAEELLQDCNSSYVNHYHVEDHIAKNIWLINWLSRIKKNERAHKIENIGGQWIWECLNRYKCDQNTIYGTLN